MRAGLLPRPRSASLASELSIRRNGEPRKGRSCNMGILDDLLAGGQIQKEYKDFVNRYEQGDPSEGYSDQEALGKLSPEERAEFLKMLQERAAARGVKLPGKVASDPKDLGQVLTDLHEKPGQLRDILAGGDSQTQEQVQGSNPIIDMLSSPLAKAVLAGIATVVIKRMTGSSSQA